MTSFKIAEFKRVLFDKDPDLTKIVYRSVGKKQGVAKNALLKPILYQAVFFIHI